MIVVLYILMVLAHFHTKNIPPVLLNLLLQCTSCHWIVFTSLSVKLTYNTNNRFDYFQQCSTVRYLLSTVDELRYRLGCMRKIVSKLSLWVNCTLVRYRRKDYLSKLSLWVNCTLVSYRWKEYLGVNKEILKDSIFMIVYVFLLRPRLNV
jgi:hypothetical protein